MDDFKSQDNLKRRTSRSADEWRTLIEHQRRSGLSIRRFCREQGLCENSFYRWRRRLETSEHGGETSPPFVRLGLSADAAASPDDLSIVVRFADGVELHAGAERLSELVALLRDGPADRGER